MDPDIALFARVVEAGSLSAAARALGISPAMVSKRIARLEARLGVRLLDRTTRRLQSTPRGERFYRDVTIILDALNDAETRVIGQGAVPAGPLRVSAPTSFGRLHIVPLLKPFLDRYPKVEKEIDLSDAFVDVTSERIDLAIRIAPAIDSRLGSHRLANSRRLLCAAPSYLAQAGEPATPDGLSGHRLLAASGQLPWRLAGAAGEVIVEGVSYVRTNSSEVVRELTLAGVGVALRSLWDVDHDLASGRLTRVLPDLQGSMDVGIFAVHPRGQLSTAAKALLQYLHELWSPSPPWGD